VLLAVPNVSEGRDPEVVDALAGAFAPDAQPVRLLDVHSDPDHHRSVFTIAGEPGTLAAALLSGAREALARIDLVEARGLHPHVGVVDVVPIVHLDDADRGAACAEALVTADLLARELELPVFLYGALGGGRTRAELREGGVAGLAGRVADGTLAPDFGPAALDPRRGATLVAARPPLVAFNLELATDDVAEAKHVAAQIREGGPAGMTGVKAIGLRLELQGGITQLSVNVEDPAAVPLADLIAAVRAYVDVTGAELVGLAPRAALDGFQEDVPLRNRRTIEDALADPQISPRRTA
jgi:glutamate formiminotransferase